MCNTFIANRANEVRPGSSGRLVPGYDARIVDDHDRSVPDGESGHLLISGASAAQSYWKQPELSARIFTGSWVRTGDRYRRDADGYFWFEGRADDLLKVSGMWVSPSEVEAALVEHEAVLEAGVVGATDQDQLIKPMAFVVLKDGHAGDAALDQELKNFVKERLAPYKYPRWIRFVAELPKTATGKVQRYKLRAMAAIR
jgi:acyl-coenzyme A synthetase/AMP-(fatty) acid ligase